MKMLALLFSLGLALSSIACSAGEVAEPTGHDVARPGTSPVASGGADPKAPSTTGSSSGGASSSSSGAPGTPAPAQPDGPTFATHADQITAGQATFAAVCSRCHGASGEGRSAPRLVGLDSGALASFKSAEEVAAFAASNMPVSSKGEAYAVVAYLVEKNGIANDRVLDATVAPTIALH